jgi:type II secretory pathway pseudopilin PulG
MRTQRMGNAEGGMRSDRPQRVLQSDTFRAPHCALRTEFGFTMIEIALSLAIIGFALVAIIGVLPIGMNTQKDNREQTIINQDATVWINAIRNGALGVDDLTNYVMAITNYVTFYDQNMRVRNAAVNGYTRDPNSPFPLNSGARIIGLLSTPKYATWTQSQKLTGIVSNHVVAYVRALSGTASDKYPQDNAAVQDMAFAYRMVSEVIPYGTNYYDPSWTVDPVMQTNVANLNANLHDLRLLFRWPLRSRDQVGLGGQSYRTIASGQLRTVTDSGQDLYFFDPRTYVKVK